MIRPMVAIARGVLRFFHLDLTVRFPIFVAMTQQRFSSSWSTALTARKFFVPCATTAASPCANPAWKLNAQGQRRSARSSADASGGDEISLSPKTWITAMDKPAWVTPREIFGGYRSDKSKGRTRVLPFVRMHCASFRSSGNLPIALS